jgi:predicted HAD superfamily phosphohydrolase YqeG
MGVNRHRTSVQQWVQKVDLESIERADPNHFAVDKSMIQFNFAAESE